MATKEWWEVDTTDTAKMWQRIVGQSAVDETETAASAAHIFADVPQSSEVLEVGAGVGRLVRYAATIFPRAVGVDYSEALVDFSKTFLAGSSGKVLLGDGLLLPLPDEHFDFVYSFICFQHMPTLEIVQSNIREMYRVLRYGGTCRVQTVQGTPDPAVYDGCVFTSPEVFWQEFRAVGFTLLKLETGKTHPSHIWISVTK